MGPAVNIKRSPLCGRNFEYYSEDPYLAGETAAAFIGGVQKHHVGTSIKHFAANNQELNRMSCSSEVDERTMREIYLPAFETAVKKSAPKTVMCSYNRINGVFSSENHWLLTEILRDEWGFDGYVVSDWGAVNERVKGLLAGMDLEMPASGGITDAEIVEAVQDGQLDVAVLDETVTRILNVIFDWTDHRETRELTFEEDHALAREIAENSIVLLKNEGMLPLDASEKIAFIGGFAKDPRYQGGGSSHINSFRVSSALDAVKSIADVTFAKGFSSTEDAWDDVLAAEAIAVAKNADKAVIFAGLPESFESEGYDRTHMRLPECQNRLIQEILAVQKNVIVVLHNGSPVEMPVAFPFGHGLSYTTFAYSNLRVEKAASTGAEGIVGISDGQTTSRDCIPADKGCNCDSNTTSSLNHDSDEYFTISVDITNTGNRAGKEIVQLYVRDCTGCVTRPLKELKGFAKVSLAPGETKTATMTLNRRSFSWYNTDLHDWYAADGTYQILIGASSQDIRLSQSIELSGAPMLPLKLNLNTTLGTLLADSRTHDFAASLKRRLDIHFGLIDGNASEDEAVSDDMGEAVAQSLPLRNVVTFGMMGKEELIRKIDELNRL